LLIYLASNIKDAKPDQLRQKVNEVLEEGGAMMSTVYQELINEGKDIGVKEGEEKNKLRVAFNCLMKGMDVATISEITELSIARIEALKATIRPENS
jgi:predicted transposase/invertase (TIGR01784 family)